ncbi:MAG: hypothetical protein GX565_16535 [Lentisphaerae bacterium]|nr:hypothetical protein [Lentisphaerota bacterium]
MKVTNQINSARAARAAFLAEIQPALRKQYHKGLPQNRQCCDIRTAWCDWIDTAAKSGRIPEHLANTAIL